MTTQIRKTWRNILVLTVLAVAFGTLAWMVPEDPSGTPKGERTTLMDAELRIDTVAIRTDKHGYQLRRENDAWLVISDSEPRPGKEQNIRKLLAALHAPVGPSYAASEFNLAEVRLDPPMARIEINGSIQLALGDYTGIDQQRYLRATGLREADTVHLVSPLLGYYIEQPPGFYIASENDDQQETPARN